MRSRDSWPPAPAPTGLWRPQFPLSCQIYSTLGKGRPHGNQYAAPEHVAFVARNHFCKLKFNEYFNQKRSTMNQDKTTSKVALCSAIFAGFAYVGYAVVKQVFGRGRREEEVVVPGGLMGFFRDETDVLGLDYEPADPTGRVFLRRLSGSRAGRGGTLLAEAGDSVLRPLSVRERIRQLNLSAVAFTDTLLVLHGLKPRQSRMSSSLPSSAFHSPTRILSPIDLQLEFLNRDEEDAEKMLEGRDSNDNYSVPGTPRGLSRRSSRRNLARRSLANSLANSVVSLSQAEQEEADSRAETLCQVNY